MIAMMRKEVCSGSIADLAHATIHDCLSDCLTKHSAKPENLMKAIKTGTLPAVDNHPNFSSLMQHRTYLTDWCSCFLAEREVTRFLGVDISKEKPGLETNAHPSSI